MMVKTANETKRSVRENEIGRERELMNENWNYESGRKGMIDRFNRPI